MTIIWSQKKEYFVIPMFMFIFWDKHQRTENKQNLSRDYWRPSIDRDFPRRNSSQRKLASYVSRVLLHPACGQLNLLNAIWYFLRHDCPMQFPVVCVYFSFETGRESKVAFSFYSTRKSMIFITAPKQWIYM